MLETIVCSG